MLEASVSHRRAEASCKDLARVGELGMENWSGVAHRLWVLTETKTAPPKTSWIFLAYTNFTVLAWLTQTHEVASAIWHRLWDQNLLHIQLPHTEIHSKASKALVKSRVISKGTTETCYICAVQMCECLLFCCKKISVHRFTLQLFFNLPVTNSCCLSGHCQPFIN